MAYNSNTRLLLQFEDSPDYDGDTSEWQRACTFSSYVSIYTNTSPHGAGTGHCLFCDGLNSSGQIGQISVDSPAGLFANIGTSTKLISLHYSVEATQDASASGLFDFTTSAGDNIRLYTKSDGKITFIGTNGGLFIAQSAANSANEFGTGWHHLYVYSDGTNVKIGLDGAQVVNYTHTSNIWGSGTLTGAAFGQGQNYWSHYGFMDSIQVLEADSTWTGGAYTVPGKPSNYLAPGTPINVDLTGQDLVFSQGDFGVGLPVNINVTGQVLEFSTPKLVPRVTPSVFRNLWANQPTKRLRGDLLNPMTDNRLGAYDIAREFWQVPPAPSSNVSVGLAGQSLSFDQGGISASYTGPVTVSLTGISYSYSQGAPAAAAAIPLVGQAYSYALGGIAANRSVALNGQAYSYAQGSIGAGVDKFAAVTGQSFSFSQGSVTASQQATYNSNTRLQMRFNEANGSTTTDDSSVYDRTSTFSGPAQIGNAQVKFGAGSLELGNPGGTKTHSYVSIDSPAGLLSQSTSSAKRFDFWTRRVSSNSGAQCLLSLRLQNSDELAIYNNASNQMTVQYAEGFGGTATSANGTFTNPFPYANWNHVRVLVYGNAITVGVNGSQIATVTRSGGTDIWRASDVNEILLGSWPTANAAHTMFYAYGYMDSLVITEGDTSWTGGSYTVPTAEPEDPPSGGGITGEGANEVDAVTSTGSLILGRLATGENTTDAVTSVGAGYLEKFMVGASALDDVTTEGVLALGTVIYASGQNTLDTIESVGTAVMMPRPSSSATSLTCAGPKSGTALDCIQNKYATASGAVTSVSVARPESDPSGDCRRASA